MAESKCYSMLNATLLPVVLAALVVWLVGLSVAFYWLLAHYQRLGKGVKSGNLMNILEQVIQVEDGNRRELAHVKKQIDEVEGLAGIYFQKLGLVRFNPFSETGGDQSFALSLLDRNNNGFIITCLHTRDRTRVYAKPIVAGKSKYELSKEEEKALASAQAK